jgi:hypothetical protein
VYSLLGGGTGVYSLLGGGTGVYSLLGGATGLYSLLGGMGTYPVGVEAGYSSLYSAKGAAAAAPTRARSDMETFILMLVQVLKRVKYCVNEGGKCNRNERVATEIRQAFKADERSGV